MSWVIEDFGNNDLTGPRPARLAFCDQNTMRDLHIVRDDDTDAALADELPRYFTCAAFEYLDERALGLAAPVDGGVS